MHTFYTLNIICVQYSVFSGWGFFSEWKIAIKLRYKRPKYENTFLTTKINSTNAAHKETQHILIGQSSFSIELGKKVNIMSAKKHLCSLIIVKFMILKHR